MQDQTNDLTNPYEIDGSGSGPRWGVVGARWGVVAAASVGLGLAGAAVAQADEAPPPSLGSGVVKDKNGSSDAGWTSVPKRKAEPPRVGGGSADPDRGAVAAPKVEKVVPVVPRGDDDRPTVDAPTVTGPTETRPTVTRPTVIAPTVGAKKPDGGATVVSAPGDGRRSGGPTVVVPRPETVEKPRVESPVERPVV